MRLMTYCLLAVRLASTSLCQAMRYTARSRPTTLCRHRQWRLLQRHSAWQVSSRAAHCASARQPSALTARQLSRLSLGHDAALLTETHTATAQTADVPILLLWRAGWSALRQFNVTTSARCSLYLSATFVDYFDARSDAPPETIVDVRPGGAYVRALGPAAAPITVRAELCGFVALASILLFFVLFQKKTKQNQQKQN